ncbi:hypothetical protein PUN28_014283 [Cardiocondyla obscurior]|uniref:Uncharacterized protein n=1 Tax=Cardiocondyla obscurior TaxID=286306 RepID=A0AAW2EZA1_9HYME
MTKFINSLISCYNKYHSNIIKLEAAVILCYYKLLYAAGVVACRLAGVAATTPEQHRRTPILRTTTGFGDRRISMRVRAPSSVSLFNLSGC